MKPSDLASSQKIKNPGVSIALAGLVLATVTALVTLSTGPPPHPAEHNHRSSHAVPPLTFFFPTGDLGVLLVPNSISADTDAIEPSSHQQMVAPSTNLPLTMSMELSQDNKKLHKSVFFLNGIRLIIIMCTIAIVLQNYYECGFIKLL